MNKNINIENINDLLWVGFEPTATEFRPVLLPTEPLAAAGRAVQWELT